jgi:predicted nuclease with TOPRIM domain
MSENLDQPSPEYPDELLLSKSMVQEKNRLLAEAQGKEREISSLQQKLADARQEHSMLSGQFKGLLESVFHAADTPISQMVRYEFKEDRFTRKA